METRQFNRGLRNGLASLGAGFVLAALGGAASVQAQTIYTYYNGTSATSNAYLNASHWTVGGATSTKFPGLDNSNSSTADGTAADIAAFGAVNFTTSSGLGINFGTSTATGVTANTGANGALALGAFEFTSAATASFAIGNSATTMSGVLTLNGVTVNGVANSIISNEGTGTYTFAPVNSGTATTPMTIALGNTTTNVIQTSNTGNIVISTAITGVGRNLAFQTSYTGTGTAGTLTLSGANTFSGTFTASSGTVILGGTTSNGVLGWVSGVSIASGASVQIATTGFTDVINNSAAVTVNGTLDLTGGIETIGSLAGTSTTGTLKVGKYSMTNATGTVTVGADNTSTTFAGVVAGTPNVATDTVFIKQGTGTLTLTGASTYTGGTSITGGTLALDSNNTTTARLAGTTRIVVSSGGNLSLAQSGITVSTDRINNSANVTLSGSGKFSTGGFSEGTAPTSATSTDGAAGMGVLTLQNTTSSLHATIDFGPGANGSALVFSSLTGGSGTYVDILNWTGTAAADDGTATNDRLLFSTNPMLSNTALANYTFFDDLGNTIAVGGTIIAFGNEFEIVPVPEPATVLGGLLLVGILGWNQRRRLGGLAGLMCPAQAA